MKSIFAYLMWANTQYSDKAHYRFAMMQPINNSRSMDAADSQPNHKKPVNGEPRIFMGGIPKDMKPVRFEQIVCDTFDDIKEVSLIMENDSTNKGFAFVQFNTIQGAENALEMMASGTKPGGFSIHSSWAEPESLVSQAQMEKVDGVHVSNLANCTSRDAIWEHFGGRSKVYRVAKQRNFAFVHFVNREDARLAVQKFHRTPLHGCIIEVKLAKPAPARPPATIRLPPGAIHAPSLLNMNVPFMAPILHLGNPIALQMALNGQQSQHCNGISNGLMNLDVNASRNPLEYMVPSLLGQPSGEMLGLSQHFQHSYNFTATRSDGLLPQPSINNLPPNTHNQPFSIVDLPNKKRKLDGMPMDAHSTSALKTSTVGGVQFNNNNGIHNNVFMPSSQGQMMQMLSSKCILMGLTQPNVTYSAMPNGAGFIGVVSMLGIDPIVGPLSSTIEQAIDSACYCALNRLG